MAFDTHGTCRWTLYPGAVEIWDTLGGGSVFFISLQSKCSSLLLFLAITYEGSVQTDVWIF
jgi:hypothetical protein